MWAKVTRATADGELGIAAKISPREEPDRHRLVCVYTRDFNDKDDVARVLKRLKELDLVRQKHICYKTGWRKMLADQLSQCERCCGLTLRTQMPSPTWGSIETTSSAFKLGNTDPTRFPPISMNQGRRDLKDSDTRTRHTHAEVNLAISAE